MAPCISRKQIVEIMLKLLHVSRKTLHKHTKVRVRIYENDEFSYCTLISRKPYRDMLLAAIRPTMVEFLEIHSCAILDQKLVLRKCLSRGVYVEHAKHVLEMIEVALFEEF